MNGLVSNRETKPTAFRTKFSAELSNLRFGRTSWELPEYIDCRIHEGVKSTITYAENISASHWHEGGRGEGISFDRKYIPITCGCGFVLNVWKIRTPRATNLLQRDKLFILANMAIKIQLSFYANLSCIR